MSSSSALDNVIGGKLKLKRSTLPSNSSQPKKKKKISKKAVIDEEKQHDQVEPDELAPIIPPSKTQAEIKFEQTRKKLEERLIAKKIEKTHRQKIEQFNNHLSSLSEHYDIPKVGPG